MGISKTEQFTEKQNHISLIFKALGHPARLAIVEHLLRVNSCICNDLVTELPLAQPTISQHLKELKAAGIIKGSIEGKSICYCLDESAFETLQTFFGQMEAYFDKQKNTCC